MPVGGSTLTDILLGAGPDHAKPAPGRLGLHAACVDLIERHVAQRAGLKGIALRTGLGMAKAAKPQILPRAAEVLLPEFAVALEPLYRQFRASGGNDFAAHLVQNEPEAVGALLGVADRKMARSPNGALKAVYARLRGGAEAELSAILPKLAETLSAHLPGTAKTGA